MIARELAEEPQVTIAAQPTRGLDVGAIEFVHRRLLEQRDAGRGVLLVSLELEEIRSLSDRVLVIYEGRIVAELSPDASRRGAGRRDARREGVVVTLMGSGDEGGQGRSPSRRGCRATCAAAGSSSRSSPRCSRSSSAGSSSRSPGANPIDTYKAIFDGSGLNWLFPWVTGDDRTLAALNLQQTLILTTPLILTGLAVAFAFRAGLFNIGGQGQYLVGSVRRRLRRLLARRHAGAAAHRPGDRRRLRRRRAVGGHRRRC